MKDTEKQYYMTIANFVSEIEGAYIDSEDESYAAKSMRELGLSSLDAVLLLMKIEYTYQVQFDFAPDTMEEIIRFLVSKETEGVSENA